MEIIWIDGTFGVGKSTVSSALSKRLRKAYVLEFDKLQERYKPNSVSDVAGERYPEARRYLVDALVKEIKRFIEVNYYDYLIIPIALINDYCRCELAERKWDCVTKHIILFACQEVVFNRAALQPNRDIDLVKTYMDNAVLYLNRHYADAFRIDTSAMSIDAIVNDITAFL